MSNLTKRKIVLEIYAKTEFLQQDITVTVQLTLDLIRAALAQRRKVLFPDFGTFTVERRAARVIPNVYWPGKVVRLPVRATVKFRAGQELRRRMEKTDLSRLRLPSRYRR